MDAIQLVTTPRSIKSQVYGLVIAYLFYYYYSLYIYFFLLSIYICTGNTGASLIALKLSLIFDFRVG